MVKHKVLESDKCPICMNIMIEPITLPCKHEFCRECLDNTVSESAMQCPLCRFRLSNWLRKAKSTAILINEDKWRKIRNRYPLYVAKKIANETLVDEVSDSPLHRQLAKPGELRAEYEQELKRLRAKWMDDRRAEEEASIAFVRQLNLQDESDAQLDTFVLENSSANNVPRRSDSMDSITRELNSSFQPIDPSPRTPPKPSNRKSPGVARCWPIVGNNQLPDKENLSPLNRWLLPNSSTASTSCIETIKKKHDFDLVRSPVLTRSRSVKGVIIKKKKKPAMDNKTSNSKMLSAFLTISKRLVD